MQVQLSVVIITFNESRNIGRCLDSLVGVADEIVVVDSFSTDETVAICRRKGARVFQHSFAGHIEQKNVALEQAQHPWVLSLDADEALSETLRKSILEAKGNWQADGYSMNRRTNYCGQWINHSGWYPDRKLRLFDKRLGYWGGQNPHDKVIMNQGCRVEQLAGDLLHYSYYSVEEHVERVRRYAIMGAQALHSRGKKGSYWKLIFNPPFKFIRNYLLRRGFLDGRAGFTVCRIAALETFWKYRELLRMGKSKT